MKRKIEIPIYDAIVYLVVDNNIYKRRKEMEQFFGPPSVDQDYNALCSYGSGHVFALFFLPEALTVKIISHEVFHLTHRILDWVGANFDPRHHEQGALLHGYLMEKIIEIIKANYGPNL